MNAIALVGPPNSGKTTLFNWLTGRKQQVVNYPGSTVDISIGHALPSLGTPEGEELAIIDTPGTYSLFPKSLDEEITLKTLYDENYDIKKVIVVLDSTQIARQIHLVRQLQEAGFCVVTAVTMHDLHLRENSEVNLRLLSEKLKVPVCPIDGVLGGGVKALLQTVLQADANMVNKVPLQHWSTDKLRAVFTESEDIANSVVNKKLLVFSKTEAKDKVLLHPILGPLIFVFVMLTLFSSIYWVAQPIMDLVDVFFSLSNQQVKTFLGSGFFSDLIADGVISGLGAVMVFVPQIFILFVGISLLEDSGYLSRAATIIDKPLSRIGLNGKAFVPLLSGFACAVPAMMAARSINSQKERWIAMFIIPFMTCSARLPVYALLLLFLYPNEPFKAGLFLSLIYVGSIVIGAIAATILNKIVRLKTPSFFLLELPLYRRPLFKTVIRNSIKRTRSYVMRTGPIILILSVVLWVLTTFPQYKETNKSVRLQHSYAATMGTKMEWVFRPMGVDWRVGVGLISAFAAREVFVSSLAVMFNIVESDSPETLRSGIIEQMQQAKFADGSPIFTFASVVSLLVFFMLAFQCMATFATAKQEMGSMRFAIIQLVSMNVLAYILSVITYSVIAI